VGGSGSWERSAKIRCFAFHLWRDASTRIKSALEMSRPIVETPKLPPALSRLPASRYQQPFGFRKKDHANPSNPTSTAPAFQGSGRK
jgi:hypothetical protein